jgi:hypothetical protein
MTATPAGTGIQATVQRQREQELKEDGSANGHSNSKMTATPAGTGI